MHDLTDLFIDTRWLYFTFSAAYYYSDVIDQFFSGIDIQLKGRDVLKKLNMLLLLMVQGLKAMAAQL